MKTDALILAPTLLQREAWRALLSSQPDIHVSGAISHSSGLSQFPKSLNPTSLLIDVANPTLDLVRDLKLAAPHISLLCLVSAYELALIIPLLQAGVTGFASLHDSVGDLARALIAVGRGEIVLPSDLALQALSILARGDSTETALLLSLSEREREVLRLLARGLTNKDIAQTMLLSVRTVEAHLYNIFDKLNVRSRTEAALWAVKHSYGSEK